MATFTEMPPGNLHYMMDQQNLQATHQNSSYAFMYGNAPSQLVPNYPQQQQPQQQQQQHQRSRQGSGLPPTPPGSPRPHNGMQHSTGKTQQQQQHQHASFTSPVRSQAQLTYPEPSPHQQNASFMKQEANLYWSNQQPQQNAVPTFNSNLAFPEQSTSPSLVHALTQATQPRRQRSQKKEVPDDLKDEKYFERRKRNNVAAKKSRDSRKAREDEISIRANFLEKENAILRAQVATLRDEASSLRQLLLQKQVTTSSSGSLGQIGNRPVTSTPAKPSGFTMSNQQQPQQSQSLAVAVAHQAAAAYAAAAFPQLMPQSDNNQDIINSTA